MTVRETDLYQPVKHFLEAQGYEVKGEVKDCDIVAMRGEEPPVIVELKTGFTLQLLYQGVDRQSISDQVYLAIPGPQTPRQKKLWRKQSRDVQGLCRRLGLGLLLVSQSGRQRPLVEPLLDPAPYRPRQNKRRQNLLLREFASRLGDPNTGGATRTPIITAYRQDALRCARFLHQAGPSKLSEIRNAVEVERAGGIMQKDVYGWFCRVERGVYELTPKGAAALQTFADAIHQLEAA